MHNYAKELQQELLASKPIPMFEIAVLDKSGSRDWITCNIYIERNSIIAQREAVSSKEERSKFIASSKLVISSFFSLDEHLQELHDIITDDIERGGIYTTKYEG